MSGSVGASPNPLTPRGRRLALAVATAALPAHGRFASADGHTVDRAAALLSGFGPLALRAWTGALESLEQAARVATGGHGLSALAQGDAAALLSAWSDSGLGRRSLVLAVTAPLKAAYFDDASIYASFGATWRFEAEAEAEAAAAGEARPRWMAQVTDGATLGPGAETDCDVVVVGTGAGGAVVASGLARAGLAVLMVEEGQYHARPAFDGSTIQSVHRFYRDRGTTGSVGNVVIPIPMGQLVGGSTAINTGTCWRTPEWVLDSWARAGLADLAPERMMPWFTEVENRIGVERAGQRYLGGVARVVARGADALGWSHRALDRNAPSCDGSGVCDFGCPTGARRSTDLAYVPDALEHAAQLWTGVRAERVLFDRDRAVGIEGIAVATGQRVRVRARATVLACGTLLTPVMLQRQGLARSLRHLGRNLTVHPATTVSARFDEEIRGYAAIPQGYCVDELHREGILLMGASAPIDVGAVQLSFVGSSLMEVMDDYDRVASFGVMVTDEPSGSVRALPGGRALVTYWLGREENERLRRGTAAMARVFLAAGARAVYPALHGHRVIQDSAGVQRLLDARIRPSDWLLSAFHPLGTCRMATSASQGVVGPDHQVFGHPGLYLVDGSVVPSSVWVNPQVTIMALATRAAVLLAERLEAATFGR